MNNAIYLLESPVAWSNLATYKPNSTNYPLVTLPQVEYNDIVYTYMGKSVTGATPNNDPVAVPTYSSSFRSYLLLTGVTVATVASGVQPLTTVSGTTKSTDITIVSNRINLPLNGIYNVQVALNVTSGATSGATFTISGTNCTVVSQSIAVGASVTAGQYILNAIVTTTSTANPSIALSGATVTGTVAINANSSLTLNHI